MGLDRNVFDGTNWEFGEVAPFAGAWIETPSASSCRLRRRDRRFARRGASYMMSYQQIRLLASPPSRGRGSKHVVDALERAGGVSPLSRGVDRSSTKMRVRLPSSKSPPSQGRGSKRRAGRHSLILHGSPLRGAWIEAPTSGARNCWPVAPSAGGVQSKQPMLRKQDRDAKSPPSRGRGSKPKPDVPGRKKRPGTWVLACAGGYKKSALRGILFLIIKSSN